MTGEYEQVERSLHSGWQAVGDTVFSALRKVALELGGEPLAKRVALEAASDGGLPDPSALKMLEDFYPGSAEQVIRRSTDIQAETHEAKLAALRSQSSRKYGRVLLEGLSSFNLLGAKSKTRR